MSDERFLSLAAVQRELSLSGDEVLSLIGDRKLLALRLMGSWRVERTALEQFIARCYGDAVAELGRREALRGEGGRTAEPAQDQRSVSPDLDGAVALPALTPQMRRVLELVAAGLSNAEIAEELTLEVSTVKSHVSRLLARLGLPNRERLIAFAWSSGVVRV